MQDVARSPLLRSLLRCHCSSTDTHTHSLPCTLARTCTPAQMNERVSGRGGCRPMTIQGDAAERCCIRERSARLPPLSLDVFLHRRSRAAPQSSHRSPQESTNPPPHRGEAHWCASAVVQLHRSSSFSLLQPPLTPFSFSLLTQSSGRLPDPRHPHPHPHFGRSVRGTGDPDSAPSLLLRNPNANMPCEP